MKWTLVAFCATAALAYEWLLDVSDDGTRALVARYEGKDKRFLDFVDTSTGKALASIAYPAENIRVGRFYGKSIATILGSQLRPPRHPLHLWDIAKASMESVEIEWPKDWQWIGLGYDGTPRAEFGPADTPKRWDGVSWHSIDEHRCPETRIGHGLRTKSHDGNFAVWVEDRLGDRPDGRPYDKALVNVASPRDCKLIRSFAIAFPEVPHQKGAPLAPKNKYWANVRMGRGGYDELVAISPDSKLLTVAYSIKTDGIYSNILAKIAFFSMSDGKRIDAFQVAILRDNVFKHLFPVPESNDISTGPWSGALRFSADGKWLYGSTSKFHRIKVPE